MINMLVYNNHYYEKELDDLAFNYYLKYTQLIDLHEFKKAQICLKMFRCISTAQRVLKKMLIKSEI